MSQDNYMRIIDLRGKELTRAEMLDAMPRAEMGTDEASRDRAADSRQREGERRRSVA